MTRAKTLFIAVAGLVAVLPGVGLLLKVLTPPLGLGPESVALVEALSAIAVIVTWINREAVRRWSKRTVNTAIVLWTCGGLASLLFYLLERRYLNVALPNREPVTFPLWVSGNLADAVADAGGRSAAILKYGAVQLNELAANFPFALFLSDALLLVTYQALFTCLAIAFALGAARLTAD